MTLYPQGGSCGAIITLGWPERRSAKRLAGGSGAETSGSIQTDPGRSNLGKAIATMHGTIILESNGTQPRTQDKEVPHIEQWQLATLIEAVGKELAALGISKETLRKYHYYGFLPISKHFTDIGKQEYSPEDVQAYVLKIYEEVRAGNQSYNWFKLLRKVVELLSEYAATGRIVWRRLARWTTKQLTPLFSEHLTALGQHLISQGYQPTTLGGHLPVAKYFLHYLEKRKIYEAAHITKNDILAYIQAIAERYTRINDILSRMRMFLTFLNSRRLTSKDFTPLLRMGTAAKHKYYLGFTKDEQDKLISSIERNSAHGKRDYAMFRLASQTGLRAIDVVNLKFGDID